MKETLEKILTVEDAFAIKDRGVMVTPWILQTEFREKSLEMFVALRRPDGSESRMLARFSMPHVSHPDKLCFGCLLVGARLQDVPVGSEISRFVEVSERA